MDRFKGKRIAVVGLSTEGQDALRFFLSKQCDIMACDRRSQEVLFTAYPQLSSFSVQYFFGSSYLEHIQEADIIVRTAGMALSIPELQNAAQMGKEMTSSTKLFFELCKAPIIGVTGTKGKGTTATLILKMLEKQGVSVYLGGNVGTPLLSVVASIPSDAWVVLELSSFQLEDLTQSPHIAVVLTITQDHLANYDPLASNFHASRDAYVDAKRHIVSHQKKEDIAIFNGDDPTSSSFVHNTPARKLFYGKKAGVDASIENNEVFLRAEKGRLSVAALSNIQLLGAHNLENIAAASLAAQIAGADITNIRAVAHTFSGLPHRLEKIAVKNGITFINDSFSTTPETTIAAIAAFDKPIILIVGGSEKGSDFTNMGKVISQSSVKKVVVVGQMTGRITKALYDARYKGEIVTGCTTMHDMVEKAVKEAKPSDIVLLSPACASFDLFTNYKDRGKQFVYEISHLS